MKTALIFNPNADNGRALSLFDQVVALISEFTDPEIKVTKWPGHARQLAKEFVDDGVDLLIAVGGDGTVHETVNGMADGGRTDTRLGIVPVGTGNDLLIGMGFKRDLAAAVPVIFKGEEQRIDLARIEDDRGRFELVTNGIGIGFDATVNIQSRTITRIHGFPKYTLAALRTIALYFHAPQVSIRFDEETIEQKILLIAIGLGPRVGGGFYLTPDAVHDDDMLDSCTVDPVGRLTMLAMLPRVMQGTHVSSKYVKMRRNKLIDIKSDSPLPIHVDGEVFAYPDDNVRRLTITSLPKALRIMSFLKT